MPNGTTRRTVSVRGLTYQRLRAYCQANGVAMSAVTEKLIGGFLDSMGQPDETVLHPRPSTQKREVDAASGIWTF